MSAVFSKTKTEGLKKKKSLILMALPVVIQD
jgi:hypothetical protein